MGSFYQNGIVANLHDFSYGTSAYDNYQKLEKDLIEFSNTNPMELILPCLFSEINGKALPKIIDEINKIKFLNHIVIGLDRANREELPITTFTNRQSAKSFMHNISEKYELCQKLVGLYKTNSSCFKYEVKECAGACLQEESVEDYNQKVNVLIELHRYDNKNMLIIDRGRYIDEKSVSH